MLHYCNSKAQFVHFTSILLEFRMRLFFALERNLFFHRSFNCKPDHGLCIFWIQTRQSFDDHRLYIYYIVSIIIICICIWNSQYLTISRMFNWINWHGNFKVNVMCMCNLMCVLFFSYASMCMLAAYSKNKKMLHWSWEINCIFMYKIYNQQKYDVSEKGFSCCS